MISNESIVTRPQGSDDKVTLTAALAKYDMLFERIFKIPVLANDRTLSKDLITQYTTDNVKM